MLKAPFIRKTVAERARLAVPLEYRRDGCRRRAARIAAELQHIGSHRSPSAAVGAPPSLAAWLYRSCLLRRLLREGVVCDAMVADGIAARDFTALLHRVVRTPHSLRGGGGDAVEGSVVQLVWGVQREFLQCVLSAVVQQQQWPWTLQEGWDCATTLVADCIRPDDVLCVALLLPLARRMVAADCDGSTLRKSLHELRVRKVHGGILWLLARRATVSPRPDPQLLEAAITAACAAPSHALLVTSESDQDGSRSSSGTTNDSENEERLLSLLLQMPSSIGVTGRGSSFSPFWHVLLHEIACYAHNVLDDKSVTDAVRVGAFLSLRRVICSFRRHGRVRPVLELHNTIIAPWRERPQNDPSAAAGRCGPLVYREAMLLDAYTLMTLGHIGETAIDVDEAAAHEMAAIQARCVAHLDTLARSEPSAGADRDAVGLHRGARAGIVRRLHEGIRLSFKLLLRRGDHVAIQRLLTRCPALGGSWEGGKALVMLGRYAEAVDVFTQFLESTRRHFSGGLPHHIRNIMLEAVEGAACSCISDGKTRVVERLLDLYEQTRRWSFPIPAAVAFAAIVRSFILPDETKLCMATPERLELLSTLLHRRVANAAYKRDGLLLETVEVYTTLLAECRDTVKTSHFDLLLLLQHAQPGLPVYRVALLQFLHLNYEDGVNAVLQHIVPMSPDATIYLALLQELPLTALETLSRHVAESAGGDRRVVSAVTNALEYKHFADEQRQPWQCYLCRQWNKKHATACRRCGSLELAVIHCRACGGFSPTSSAACLVCGAETQQHTSEHGELRARDESTVYPLRRWRCARCNHTNEPQHIFYCAKCGSAQPTMEKALTQTAFDCGACGRHNPMGLLRPWCPSCGTLSAVASAGPSKTLWRCVECGTLSPWLLTHCHGCGGAKPAPTARLDAPWYTRACLSCSATNPAWSVVCHSCGTSLAAPSTADDIDRDHAGELNGACGAIVDPTYTSCPHCGSVYANKSDIVCTKCFAHRPYAACTLWVCLRNNCMEVNLQRGGGGGSLVCSHCGATHNVAAVGGYQSNPLRYKEPGYGERIQRGGDSTVTVPPTDSHTTGAAQDEVSGMTKDHEDTVSNLPTALLLPVPSGPRKCASCGAFLQLQNIAQICQECYHCCYAPSPSTSPSAAEHDVALRLILKAMLETVRRVEQGTLSSTTALQLLRSMTTVLQRARESQLPWRGCDLANGMKCGVRPGVPVLEDDTIHGAVRDVAEIIHTMCKVACPTTALNAAVEGSTATSWDEKRPWASLALDLTDLMNHTTDYDELGFDVLIELCTLLRPQQQEHIHRETLWAYLRHMKLPREWIVNSVVCPTCLLPKAQMNGAARHTCRCSDVGAASEAQLPTTRVL